MNPQYRAFFKFGDQVKSVTVDVMKSAGIHDFYEGFWLTENFQFTKGSDCKYWIPPAALLYIERM